MISKKGGVTPASQTFQNPINLSQSKTNGCGIRLDHTIPLYKIPINSTDGAITLVQRPLIEPNKLTNDKTCLGHSQVQP